MAPLIWFALDPGSARLTHGEEDAPDCETLSGALRNRDLEPILVLPRSRWETDLAGSPPGLPPRPRTAAEIAAARAQDAELELPKVSQVDWTLDAWLKQRRGGRARQSPLRRHRHGDPTVRPNGDAGEPPTLLVRLSPWADGIVSVALVGPGAEVLPETERLFADDADGIVGAGSWRGQLEAACAGWLEDGLLYAPLPEG